MKSQLRFALVTILALIPAASTFGGSNTWDISQAKPSSSDGKVRIVGSGQRTIILEDPGISVVDDAEAPGGRALSFSGNQAKPIIPGGGPYEGTDSAVLKVNLKPAGDTTEEGTVVCHAGAYEVRVSTGGREVRFFVTPNNKAPAVMLRAKVSPEQWNTVEASVKGAEIALTTNGQTTTATLPAGGTMNPTAAFFRIGRMEGTRPYKGLISELTVSEPAE